MTSGLQVTMLVVGLVFWRASAAYGSFKSWRLQREITREAMVRATTWPLEDQIAYRQEFQRWLREESGR